VQRPELPALFAGHAHFIHDIDSADLLHGRVLHARLGASCMGWDAAAVQASAGLVTTHRDGNLLGVVCRTSAQADAALASLQSAVTWHPAALASEEAHDLLALNAQTRVVFESAAAPAPQPGAHTLQARYSKPWIAHASIAPSCALAQWVGDALQVNTHSQGIFNLRRDLARAFAVNEAQVQVTHAPGAGCYGHNGADDVAFDAAWLARQVPGQQVRVLWSRADELSQSPQGPAMVMDLQASVNAQGQLSGWQHAVTSPGHSRRPGRSATPALLGSWATAKPFSPSASIDMPLARGGGAERNAVPGYAISGVQVRAHSVHTVRRSSALRSLGGLGNVFAIESFMDELAHAANLDPLALRQQHLQHDPRGMAVLNAAAEQGGWARQRSTARSEGQGFGLGYARYKNTGAWCAVMAEVHVAQQLMVRRLTIAIDVGQPINPDGVVNQTEGGAIQATSWVLKEAALTNHISWSDYPILRFTEVPAVDVIVMPSTELSLGAGEASMGPVAGAIANALFDALGVRVRSLPFTPERLVQAMNAATP
jgi:nicotinate dehydrogenase subunit B